MAAVTIYDALAAYWSAAGLASSVGPLYVPGAPENIDPPYAVAFGASGTIERDSGASTAERPTIQVSVFAPLATAALKGYAVAEVLDAIEDDLTLLSFSSGSLLDWWRTEPPRPMPDPGVDRLGRRTGHAMLTYRAWIGRSRG